MYQLRTKECAWSFLKGRPGAKTDAKAACCLKHNPDAKVASGWASETYDPAADTQKEFDIVVDDAGRIVGGNFG